MHLDLVQVLVLGEGVVLVQGEGVVLLQVQLLPWPPVPVENSINHSTIIIVSSKALIAPRLPYIYNGFTVSVL